MGEGAVVKSLEGGGEQGVEMVQEKGLDEEIVDIMAPKKATIIQLKLLNVNE